MTLIPTINTTRGSDLLHTLNELSGLSFHFLATNSEKKLLFGFLIYEIDY